VVQAHVYRELMNIVAMVSAFIKAHEHAQIQLREHLKVRQQQQQGAPCTLLSGGKTATTSNTGERSNCYTC
jgi:hypothetical protein